MRGRTGAATRAPPLARCALNTWYVGTLLPVIGIVQVGSQAYADRYAYVPLVGIFIVVVWSAARLTEGKPATWRRAVSIAGVAAIAALSLAARAELPYWHDSVSLWERAIEVVPDNALAHNNLGIALSHLGRPDDAIDSLLVERGSGVETGRRGSADAQR